MMRTVGPKPARVNLTADDIAKMRQLREYGLTLKQIGERFNVSTMTATRAVNGKLYR